MVGHVVYTLPYAQHQEENLRRHMYRVVGTHLLALDLNPDPYTDKSDPIK